MFLQARVCPQGGDVCLSTTPLLGTDPPGADTPPKETATAADGTHPTGMHSCSILCSHWAATKTKEKIAFARCKSTLSGKASSFSVSFAFTHRDPTFPNWQNSRILPAYISRYFSKILKETLSFFQSKSINWEFRLNKTWCFLQYSKVEVSFMAYYSNLES